MANNTGHTLYSKSFVHSSRESGAYLYPHTRIHSVTEFNWIVNFYMRHPSIRHYAESLLLSLHIVVQRRQLAHRHRHSTSESLSLSEMYDSTNFVCSRDFDCLFKNNRTLSTLAHIQHTHTQTTMGANVSALRVKLHWEFNVRLWLWLQTRCGERKRDEYEI